MSPITRTSPTHGESKQLPNSKIGIAKFLSPRQQVNSEICYANLGYDQRRVVMVLNDTIKAVAKAGAVFSSIGDSDGQIRATSLLNLLLNELEFSITDTYNE